jgi:hypothetical protein
MISLLLEHLSYQAKGMCVCSILAQLWFDPCKSLSILFVRAEKFDFFCPVLLTSPGHTQQTVNGCQSIFPSFLTSGSRNDSSVNLQLFRLTDAPPRIQQHR